MPTDPTTNLLAEAQEALRSFLSTLLGQDAPLIIDQPVPTTFAESREQAEAYLGVVSPSAGIAVMLDDEWLGLLSRAMLGEEMQIQDPGAEDLIVELAGQGYGGVRTALSGAGAALADVTFQCHLPGTPLPTLTGGQDLREVSFGLRIGSASYGGFALIPAPAVRQAPQPPVQQAPATPPPPAAPARPQEPRRPAHAIDVSPIAFPDLGGETIRGDGGGHDIGLLSDVELEVTVELGRRKLPLADLLRLTTGSVLELEKLVGEPLEVYANGRLIAEGEAVVIDEQFGVRVTSLSATRQRNKRIF